MPSRCASFIVTPPRRSVWSPLGLAFLCGHCTVGGAVAVLAGLGVFPVGSVLGVPLSFLVPVALLTSLFAWWVWSGRERPGDAPSCTVPSADGDR